MQFRRKPVVVEAAQWFKNGDHPEDGSYLIAQPRGKMARLSEGKVVRYFRHPEFDGLMPCEKCGHVMHDHGWIDEPGGGVTVCPGDWIITKANGLHETCKPDDFATNYEPAQ